MLGMQHSMAALLLSSRCTRCQVSSFWLFWAFIMCACTGVLPVVLCSISPSHQAILRLQHPPAFPSH